MNTGVVWQGKMKTQKKSVNMASLARVRWMAFMSMIASIIALQSRLAGASSLANLPFGVKRSRRSFVPNRIHTSFRDANSIIEVKSTSIITETKILSRKRKTTTSPDSVWYYIKVALAGGIAGAVGSTALYPMDAAKTLRQSSPSEYASVFDALGTLLRTKTTTGAVTWHIHRVYRGVIPAAVGAIPSSALYFGAYESMKAVLQRSYPLKGEGRPPKGVKLRENNFANRLLVHALAAMSGNVLSSAVFVPKELIKQQLQFRQSGNVLGVMVDILTTQGVRGLYVGYQATLMRNIPTAVLRFSLYEELRYRFTNSQEQVSGANPKFFLAGAAAGVLASGVMTPVDVLKTRLATGTCPVDVKSCFLHVIKEEGIKGLYSGAGSRMIFSGVFSAIGFGTFEWAKGLLGAATQKQSSKTVAHRRKGGQPDRSRGAQQFRSAKKSLAQIDQAR